MYKREILVKYGILWFYLDLDAEPYLVSLLNKRLGREWEKYCNLAPDSGRYIRPILPLLPLSRGPGGVPSLPCEPELEMPHSDAAIGQGFPPRSQVREAEG